MKKHDKWLLRKMARSKTEYWYRPRYAHGRNNKMPDFEDLPQRESVKKQGYNVDTSLVKRWLHSQVGRNFDDVYAAFIARVQPKYLDQYRDCIYYYVTKASEVKIDEEGVPWQKIKRRYSPQNTLNHRFYIHPDSNILCRTKEEPRGKYRSQGHESLGRFYCYPYAKTWKGTFKHKLYPFEIFLEETNGKMLEKETLNKVNDVLTGFEYFFKKIIKQLKDFAKVNYPKRKVDDKTWHVIEARFNTSEPTNFTLLIEGKENNKVWRIHLKGREITKFELDLTP